MKLTLEYFRWKLRKAFISKARGCKKATKAVQFSTLHLSYYKKYLNVLPISGSRKKQQLDTGEIRKRICYFHQIHY